MYNIVIYIYLLGVALVSLFSKKVKKMWQGERRALGILKEKVKPDERYIWFHAASLGEFEQGRPLIESIRENYPTYKILLTFFSPSGYEVRKDYKGADIVCYLPIDTPFNARRFLRTVHPCMAFFIKYEFWYNYLHILKHRGIPTYSVSSIFRPEQIFFKWYGKKYANVLSCFTHLFVQNEQSRNLLSTIGIDRVSVVGDTRFDRVLQICNTKKDIPMIEHFCANRFVFVAGSSWQPDEEVFIPYFNQHKEWKMIIAPHVVSKEHIENIISKVEGISVCLSNATMENIKQAKCMIIDSYGLLSSIYRYASICYVGGGFGVGIHNLLEAAVWSKPVIFGPNHQKFQEARDLIKCGGGFEILSQENLQQVVNSLMTDSEALDKAGREAKIYVNKVAGATKAIMDFIKPKILSL